MADRAPKPRGRPPKPDALSPAERQRRHRERKALATPDAAEFRRLHDQLAAMAITLELRIEDVARLEARNIQLELDLKTLERQHPNQTRDLIVLKQKLAERRR
jgi:hypothetical protein